MRSISINQRYTHTISFNEIDNIFKDENTKRLPSIEKANKFEEEIYEQFALGNTFKERNSIKIIHKNIYAKRIEGFKEVFYILIFPLQQEDIETLEDVEIVFGNSIVIFRNSENKNKIVGSFTTKTSVVEALTNKKSS